MSDPLREHLIGLLDGKGAHIPFAEAVKHFPEKLRAMKPAGAPHTAWQLLEHLRIAQWDILEFSRDAKHKSPKWPEGYWPATEAPPSKDAWQESIHKYEADLKSMQALIADPKHDLYACLPHGQGQTLLKEALVLADHNSYHLGQIMYLKKQLIGEDT
jgi:hypothetical protein